MTWNELPSGERIHIAFFGLRNAGKSSLVNAMTGQELSIVSDVKGTTTDPVKKAMELLPLGPVVIIDTPGLDDEGELGEKRIKKSRQILDKTDIAVLVVDALRGLREADRALLEIFETRGLPYVVAYNKAELLAERTALKENEIYVSAVTKENLTCLREMLGAFAARCADNRKLLPDLLRPGDMVILVIPIDEAAPKGRLILPQQRVMREILDARCLFAACQPKELAQTLAALAKPPKLVITDSQAFEQVARELPDEMMLTSFSILMARYKGGLDAMIHGAEKLSALRDGDKVLISEGCTHHRQCNDIGTVKLPAWIREYSGAEPKFSFTSGGDFPEDLSDFALIVHCGGCMLNAKEVQNRLASAAKAGVPVVNYGVAIAYMRGILRRCLAPFMVSAI